MLERISTSEGAYDGYRVGIRGRPGALSLIAVDSGFVPIHNGHAHLTAPIARVVVLVHTGPVPRRCKVAAIWAIHARADRANRHQAAVGLRDCLPPLTKHPIAPHSPLANDPVGDN